MNWACETVAAQYIKGRGVRNAFYGVVYDSQPRPGAR